MKRILPPKVVELMPAAWDLSRDTQVIGPLTYNQDGLATRHNSDFATDRHFLAAYYREQKTGSWGEAEIQWHGFVECGVNRGDLAIAKLWLMAMLI